MWAIDKSEVIIAKTDNLSRTNAVDECWNQPVFFLVMLKCYYKYSYFDICICQLLYLSILIFISHNLNKLQTKSTINLVNLTLGTIITR